ncbi:MAG: hypothetical protein AAGF54_12360, partial [Pseudomonadota bacterium]
MASIFVIVTFAIIYNLGITFAADGFESVELFVLLVALSVALATGFTFLHLMNLIISPSPSVIVDDTGISYKNLGSVGYEHVGWQGMRIVERKGLFKYLFIKILLPKLETLPEVPHFYILSKPAQVSFSHFQPLEEKP